MKAHLVSVAAFTMMLLLLSSGGCMATDIKNDSRVSEEPEEAAPPVPAVEQEENLGGWEKASVEDDEVREVFMWAKERFSEENPEMILQSPDKTERQVVAGYKYRFHCSYRHTEDPDRRGKIKIIVWKKPDDSMELLSMDMEEK